MIESSDMATEPRHLHRRFLGAFAGALAVVGLAYAGWLCWLHFWPQPVAPTTLEANGLTRVLNGGRGWRNLPFRLAAEEEAAVRECERIGRTVRFLDDGVAEFDRDDARQQLEGTLAKNPGLFHAESLLALWHRRHGNADRAAFYAKRALERAPVVLVQRFEFEGGKPLVGATVPEVQVECNRVQNGSLDPSLKLTFFDLTTDDEGSVRLPVYRTVYRLFSVSHPVGHSLTLPRMGWFESRGKVGILPAATVRKEP